MYGCLPLCLPLPPSLFLSLSLSLSLPLSSRISTLVPVSDKFPSHPRGSTSPTPVSHPLSFFSFLFFLSFPPPLSRLRTLFLLFATQPGNPASVPPSPPRTGRRRRHSAIKFETRPVSGIAIRDVSTFSLLSVARDAPRRVNNRRGLRREYPRGWVARRMRNATVGIRGLG